MYKIASELCRQGIRGVLGKAGTSGFVCAGVLCKVHSTCSRECIASRQRLACSCSSALGTRAVSLQ